MRTTHTHDNIALAVKRYRVGFLYAVECHQMRFHVGVCGVIRRRECHVDSAGVGRACTTAACRVGAPRYRRIRASDHEGISRTCRYRAASDCADVGFDIDRRAGRITPFSDSHTGSVSEYTYNGVPVAYPDFSLSHTGSAST